VRGRRGKKNVVPNFGKEGRRSEEKVGLGMTKLGYANGVHRVRAVRRPHQKGNLKGKEKGVLGNWNCQEHTLRERRKTQKEPKSQFRQREGAIEKRRNDATESVG